MRTIFLLVLSLMFLHIAYGQLREDAKSAIVNYYEWESMPGKDYGDLKWYEVLDLETSTYEEVRKAFYKEWDGKPYESGKMYKQFKRFELMTLGHLSGEDKQFNAGPVIAKELQEGQVRSVGAGGWISKGPNMPLNPSNFNNQGIGRIDEVAFHPTNENIIYVGTPSGGLWKSVDGGSNWSPIGDQFASLGISGIEFSLQNPDTIYVTTGTKDGGATTTFFQVFKSTNGGTSWSSTGGVPSGVSQVHKFLVDPTNDQKLYVATNNGVHYSTNGGALWSQSTGISSRTRDIEFKPGSPGTLYASTSGDWYLSSNSAASFTLQTASFNSTTSGNINIGVTPANSNLIYFYVWDIPSGSFKLYKYIPSTNTYTTIADENSPATLPDNTVVNMANYFWGQSTYDWSFAVHPTDEDAMYIGDISLFRTTDGGANWVAVSGSGNDGGSIHVDMHTIEYSTTSNTPFVGCDGGLYKYAGATSQWIRLNNLGISQVYRLGVGVFNDDLIVCGNQDNGFFQNDGTQWNYRLIGDGTEGIIDPIDTHIIYGAIGPSGSISKIVNGSNMGVIFRESDVGENGLWTFPFKMHPCLRNVLYTGFENLYGTTDGGTQWQKLTTFSTGKAMLDMEISPVDPQFIYLCFSDAAGGVHRSEDGGRTWTACTWPGSFIIDLETSPSDPKIIFAVLNNGTVQKSIDKGVSWNDFSTGIPVSSRIRCIESVEGSVEDLYLGIDYAVYYKQHGSNWTVFDDGLPNVIINELEVNEYNGTITAATYGRGIWQSPLMNTSPMCHNQNIPFISPNDTYISLCDKTSVFLNSTQAPVGYGYQWYLGDSLLSGETNQSLVAFLEGDYSVIFTGPCKSFNSASVKIEKDCNFASCSNFNSNTASGPGNSTIVTLNGPFAYNPNILNYEFCLQAEGDLALSTEKFNVYDENGLLLYTTDNPPFDCQKSSQYCFSVSAAVFLSWTADNVITFEFDPISGDINPFFCSVNQACAAMSYPFSNCQDDLTVSDPILDAYYGAKNTLISDGNILDYDNVTFDAGQSITLLPSFSTGSMAQLTIRIGGCN